jgi:hypothetical protein
VEQTAAAFGVLLGGAALIFGAVFAGLSAARPLSPGLRAALLGLGLVALPLAKLSGTLKAVTHHRPLGAVTFAALALVGCAGAILVAARAFTLFGQSPWGRAARLGFVSLAALGPLLLLLRAAANPALRGGVVDLALGLGSGALLALVPWPSASRRAIDLFAPPLWLAAVLVGVVSALALGGAAAELASPALAAPITWFLR